MTVGFCWPYKGEPDPRFAVRHLRERGARAALPVVVAKQAPLEFREWWPGVKTTPGVFDLPVPEGTRKTNPDALFIPPVGFDARGYRLGYGGGYFDRTLAAARPQPLKIAVAFDISRMPTIHPQPHDIPMDFVVTESGILRVTAKGLETIEPAQANAAAENVVAERATARMPREELVALLNTLLEAERAGAKALSAMIDACSDPAHIEVLRRVQRDEARNCATLIELVRASGGEPSKATGDFLEKVLAVQGAPEQLAFLNRGQGWVARKIREALPRMDDGSARQALQEMLDSHVANIAACNALVQSS